MTSCKTVGGAFGIMPERRPRMLENAGALFVKCPRSADNDARAVHGGLFPATGQSLEVGSVGIISAP